MKGSRDPQRAQSRKQEGGNETRPSAATHCVEDLSALDRRTLTEMLVDKIIIERHPSKIDKNGRRNYTIRAIPYQDPEMEAARLNAVHEARVKIVPRV